MRALGTILALALIASLAVHWRTHSNLQAERLAHQTTLSDHAIAISAAQSERAAQEANHRKIEKELRDAQEAHARETAALHIDLGRARDRAHLESVRLRNAANAAAVRARAQCAAPTASDLRQAAGDPIGVLADVLGRADKRASILADLADRRGVAGRACEREYSNARKMNQP